MKKITTSTEMVQAFQQQQKMSLAGTIISGVGLLAATVVLAVLESDGSEVIEGVKNLKKE